MLRRSLGLLLPLLFPLPAYAGPAEDAARKAFEEGLAEESRGSAAACEKFRKALELIREVGPLKKVKECDVRESRLRSARDKLRELIERWPVQDAELEGFKAELIAVEARIPRLTLTAKPDAPRTMKVRVDGANVTLPANELELDPGEHEVLAEADGLPLLRTPVTLAAGERVSIELPTGPWESVAPVVVAPPPISLTGLGFAGIVVGSVGVAGLIGGAITGGLVLAKDRTYQDCLENPQCDTKTADDQQRGGKRLLVANGALLIAGAATAALGGTLLIVDLVRSPDEEASGRSESALHIGPTHVEWLVRF
jgi:hypothetical protein